MSREIDRKKSKVEDARREVEDRLDDLRTSFGRELSWLPKGRSWTLPLVALACGIALVLKKDRRSSRSARSARD